MEMTIGISIFLNKEQPQKLLLAPGATEEIRYLLQLNQRIQFQRNLIGHEIYSVELASRLQ